MITFQLFWTNENHDFQPSDRSMGLKLNVFGVFVRGLEDI